MPFRWAIFSHTEPRIVSTFSVASIIHPVKLPISCGASERNSRTFSDTEKICNCRRHDQLTTISRSLMLQHTYSPTQLLCFALSVILWTGNSVKDCKLSWTSLSELDSLDFHLINQIPESIPSSMRLLFYYHSVPKFGEGGHRVFVADICCILRLGVYV